MSNAGSEQRINMVPSDGRGIHTTVPVSVATGEKLTLVKLALAHPHERADFWGMAASVLSALLVIGKTLGTMDKAWLLTAGDVFFLLAASGLATVQIVKYASAIRKLHPFHDQAKTYVDSLIAAQAASTAAPPLAAPLSPIELPVAVPAPQQQR